MIVEFGNALGSKTSILLFALALVLVLLIILACVMKLEVLKIVPFQNVETIYKMTRELVPLVEIVQILPFVSVKMNIKEKYVNI